MNQDRGDPAAENFTINNTYDALSIWCPICDDEITGNDVYEITFGDLRTTIEEHLRAHGIDQGETK